MPRKRMISPALWDDPDLAQLTPIERLLFVGLVSIADDYGHVSAHPALLRKWIFGYDDISTAEVQAMRDHILTCCRNIELYIAGNQEYLWLKTWERHQDLRFRAKAQYPCHACGVYHTSADYNQCQNAPIPEQAVHISTQELAQSLPSDYVTLHEDTLSHVNHAHSAPAPNGAERVEDKPKARKARAKTEVPAGFEDFWEAYPKKKARAVAVKAYAKCLQEGATADAILCGVRNYSQECIRTAREWQFICFPATFLNQRRWEDVSEPPGSTRRKPHGLNQRDREQESSVASVEYDPRVHGH